MSVGETSPSCVREPVRLPELRESIAAKKDRLDRLQPLSPEALRKLEHYCDVEITYTLSAIEGNAPALHVSLARY